jgi:hypothetical protein
VTGCTESLSIMDMLSLRSELTEAHKGKLTLQQTQDAIEKFIQEKWLIPKIGSKQDKNSDRVLRLGNTVEGLLLKTMNQQLLLVIRLDLARTWD